MQQGYIEIEPYFSQVLDYRCAGCKSCLSLCPFNAISFDETKKIAEINKVLCKGCGTCASACPSSAIVQNHFGSDQLNPMIHQAVQKKSKVKE